MQEIDNVTFLRRVVRTDASPGGQRLNAFMQRVCDGTHTNADIRDLNGRRSGSGVPGVPASIHDPIFRESRRLSCCATRPVQRCGSRC